MTPKMEDMDKSEEMERGSQYKAIQKVVKMLRAGTYSYKEMFTALTDSGMDDATAERMMERLLAQVDDE